jgi:hypothetical protein
MTDQKYNGNGKSKDNGLGLAGGLHPTHRKMRDGWGTLHL